MRRTYCPTFHGIRLTIGFLLALLSVFLALPALPQTKFGVVTGTGGGGGSGTVTSVGATVPAFMSVSGSPVTTSGTLAFSFATQAQGLVFAAPCSGSGAVVFRALCAADIPALAPSKITGTAVIDSDIRLTNARTPTAHASTHAAAGSDAITITQAQVTNLVSDLAGKQATGNYVTGGTGDVVFTGPGSVAATIQANAVALGTDTTGGYAGSSTEGGAATSANALNSASTTVDVSAAVAPISGQVLTATSGTAATWQTPSTGSTLPVPDTTSIAEGSSDGTKEVRFEVDGMTASNTGVISNFGTAAAHTVSVTGNAVAAGFTIGTGAGTTSADRQIRWCTAFDCYSGGEVALIAADVSGFPQFHAGTFVSQTKYCIGDLDNSAVPCLRGDGAGFGVWNVGTGARLPFVASNYASVVVTKTANYTATSSESTILVDTTSGDVTITLPACGSALSSNEGRSWTIKKLVAANTVTIDANASETIDNALTLTMTTQNQARTVQCATSTTLFIIGGYL